MNDAVCQLRIPQNRGPGPENGVIHSGSGLHQAIGADPGVFDDGIGIDVCLGRNPGFRGEAGLKVGLTGAKIEPLRGSPDVIGTEFTAFDEFEEGRNDRDLFVWGDQVEDFGIDDINPRELVGSGLAGDQAADVGDAVAFKGEMKGGAVILDGEGGGVVGGHVAGDEAVDGQVGDDVPVIYKDRVSLDPVGDVFDSTPGFKEIGFMEESEFGSAIGSIGKRFLPGFVEVMSVDCEVSDPGVETVVEDVGDKRAIGKGDEGLGQGVGEGLQTRAQSGSKKKCFPHGRRMI